MTTLGRRLADVMTRYASDEGGRFASELRAADALDAKSTKHLEACLAMKPPAHRARIAASDGTLVAGASMKNKIVYWLVPSGSTVPAPPLRQRKERARNDTVGCITVDHADGTLYEYRFAPRDAVHFDFPAEITAGTKLSDGPDDPHAALAVFGVDACARIVTEQILRTWPHGPADAVRALADVLTSSFVRILEQDQLSVQPIEPGTLMPVRAFEAFNELRSAHNETSFAVGERALVGLATLLTRPPIRSD